VALYLLKSAIERANKLMGGWPEDEAIISQLEGSAWIPRRAISTCGPTTRPIRTQSPGSAEPSTVRVRQLGSGPDHHHTDPQHNGAARLAKAGHVSQRVDRGGELDQDHLAQGNRVSLSGSRMR